MIYKIFEIIKLLYIMLKYLLAFFLSYLTYGKTQTQFIYWKTSTCIEITNFYRKMKGEDIKVIDNIVPNIVCRDIKELINYNLKEVKRIIKKIFLFTFRNIFMFLYKSPKIKTTLFAILKKMPGLEKKLKKILDNYFLKQRSKKLSFTDLNIREQEIYQLLTKRLK